MNLVTQIYTEVSAHWEQISANVVAGWTFVCAHGGLRSMVQKFIGPKQV